MRDFELRRMVSGAVWWIASLVALTAGAGGSGLNTVVVVNQSSSNSRELANYFCERRQVPAENVLPISWSGGNISWSAAEFQTSLLNPLLAMLTDRQLTNQIDYVVLSMDIPFQTVNGSVVSSTTSALFYGAKSDDGSGGVTGAENSYAASEKIFQTARPTNAPGYSFLTTMITADSLAQAKRIVDQGVASDGAFPTNPVILAKSSDPLRNIRYHAFDNAIVNTRIRGNYLAQRVDSDSPAGQSGLLGYQTGLAGFNISPGTFVPGAIADSMTSFGGIIFGPNGQTTLMAFINAGAAGSYGTVTEPYSDANKFPNPQVYFYQSRGFSLAECYYQSLRVPYQGLIVGEPLAAPFARAASGRWLSPGSNTVLTGTAQLSAQFSSDRDHPVQQVDLFVDGKYFRTITNLAPRAGNTLTVTLSGRTMNYTVPASATIGSVTTGLVSMLNAPANSNVTGVKALAFGDRVELHFFATNPPVAPFNLQIFAGPTSTNAAPDASPVFVSSSTGSGGSLGTHLVSMRDSFLPSPICSIRGCSVNGLLQTGAWLRASVTKPAGAQVQLSVTNQSATARPMDLAAQMVSAINASMALQDLDGVAAEDLTEGWANAALFNLRARGQGYKNGLKVDLSGSSGIFVNPAGQGPLTDNLLDLQPRNHIYVAAGSTNLTLNFPLNTTALADGYHDLTAVAYEGSHVRTQARITLPVRVQNSSLSATLTSVDLPPVAPAAGTYHLQVTANAGNVSVIRLFSTGGQISSVNNQGSASFTVDGSQFGAGLHPFYSVVETATGLKYRTQTYWVRLEN